MAARPLTDPFEPRSALAVRPPWLVSVEEGAAEVASELERRRAAYPADVQRERMTREDADRHLAAWSAIADDHARHADRVRRLSGIGAQAVAALTPSYRLDWETRVRELRRELALRRNAYPRRVGSPTHPLDAATAATKLEALDAVHWRYWMELWCFAAPDVDPAHDVARHRHVVARAIARLTPTWEAGAETDDRQAARLPWVRGAARAAFADWRLIDRLAEYVGEGGWVTSATDDRTRARLLATVDAAIDFALASGCGRNEHGAIVAQLAPLRDWLAHLLVRSARPAPITASASERIAA